MAWRPRANQRSTQCRGHVVHSTLELEPCMLGSDKVPPGRSRLDKVTLVMSGLLKTLVDLAMDPEHLPSRAPKVQPSWDPMVEEFARSTFHGPGSQTAACAIMKFADLIPLAFNQAAQPMVDLKWDPMSFEVATLIGCSCKPPCTHDAGLVPGASPVTSADGPPLANPSSVQSLSLEVVHFSHCPVVTCSLDPCLVAPCLDDPHLGAQMGSTPAGL
jgi:hypothetical protein